MSGLAVVVRAGRRSAAADAARLARLETALAPTGTLPVRHVGAGETVSLVVSGDDSRGAQSTGWAEGDGLVVGVDAHLTERAALRRSLATAGHPVPATTGDAELVRLAYLVWGTDLVDHLRGEFALVVVDPGRQRLVAACDQLAARELYWTRTSSGDLLLASRLLPLVEDHDVEARPDERSVADFLLLGARPRVPGRTAFQGVARIRPAHRLVLGQLGQDLVGEPVEERYWDFDLDVPMLRYADRRDYPRHLRELLRDAVADRLEGVPATVVHLSGGLDSSTLAAVAVELMAAGRLDTRLSAITVSFPTLVPSVETYFAGEVGRHLGLDHLFLMGDDVALTQPLRVHAEPLQNFTVGLTQRLADETRQRGGLVLSGKGGDELLTETPLHRVLLEHPLPEALRLYRWLWQLGGSRPPLGGYRQYVKALTGRAPHTVVEPAFPPPVWLQPDFAARVDVDALWREAWQPPAPGTTHRTQPDIARSFRGATWSARDQLVPSHGAHQPDLTMPFADLRLLEFASGLPPAPWNSAKRLLREAMADALPEVLLRRPKTAAGDFQLTLLGYVDAGWVDDWQASDTTQRFVDRSKVPPVHRARTMERGIIDTRPLWLDAWARAVGMP